MKNNKYGGACQGSGKTGFPQQKLTNQCGQRSQYGEQNLENICHDHLDISVFLL